MNIHYVPSLLQMAMVKVSSRLIFSPSISEKIEKVLRMPNLEGIFDADKERLWNEIEREAKEMVSCLPTTAAERVGQTIKPMNAEFRYWMEDHDFQIANESVLKEGIIWKTDGTINRIETAKQLIQNENIDIYGRFTLACTYFLQDDIRNLWHQLELKDNDFKIKIPKNFAVEFWFQMLSQPSFHWKFYINVFYQVDIILQSNFKMRISSFFEFLSPTHRLKLGIMYHLRVLHYDDYRLSLLKVNERERQEILTFYPSIPILQCLFWPFQSIFLQMTQSLIGSTNANEFEVIFERLISEFILVVHKNFNYKKLLEELWHLTPPDFKEEIKQRKVFEKISIILSYDGNQSKPLGEILNEYNERDLPM